MRRRAPGTRVTGLAWSLLSLAVAGCCCPTNPKVGAFGVVLQPNRGGFAVLDDDRQRCLVASWRCADTLKAAVSRTGGSLTSALDEALSVLGTAQVRYDAWGSSIFIAGYQGDATTIVTAPLAEQLRDPPGAADRNQAVGRAEFVGGCNGLGWLYLTRAPDWVPVSRAAARLVIRAMDDEGLGGPNSEIQACRVWDVSRGGGERWMSPRTASEAGRVGLAIENYLLVGRLLEHLGDGAPPEVAIRRFASHSGAVMGVLQAVTLRNAGQPVPTELLARGLSIEPHAKSEWTPEYLKSDAELASAWSIVAGNSLWPWILEECEWQIADAAIHTVSVADLRAAAANTRVASRDALASVRTGIPAQAQATPWDQAVSIALLASDAMSTWTADRAIERLALHRQGADPAVERGPSSAEPDRDLQACHEIIRELGPVVAEWASALLDAPEGDAQRIADRYASVRKAWWWLPVLHAAQERVSIAASALGSQSS